MTSPFDHIYDLDLEISRSKLEKALSQEWERHGTKEMWIIHSWPWHSSCGWMDVPDSNRGWLQTLASFSWIRCYYNVRNKRTLSVAQQTTNGERLGHYWVVCWCYVLCSFDNIHFCWYNVSFDGKDLGLLNGPSRWVFRSPSWFIGRLGWPGDLLFYTLLLHHIDGLVQERRKSSALAMLRVSCTNPSISASQCMTTTQRARSMGPTWGPPGSCRPQVSPMLATWALLSG